MMIFLSRIRVFISWFIRLVLLSFVIQPLETFVASVADFVRDGEFTLPITENIRGGSSEELGEPTMLYEHPDGSVHPHPPEGFGQPEVQEPDPQAPRVVRYSASAMFTPPMPDPMNSSMNTVRICKNWAAVKRCLDMIETINNLDPRSPRIHAEINGWPSDIDIKNLDPKNNDEDMDLLETAGPYYIDIRCGSPAKFEQMLSDVEVMEFQIHQIREAFGIQVIGPENPETRPWPWHEHDDVPENALPVNQVPRWPHPDDKPNKPS